jgi:hypothetical protein
LYAFFWVIPRLLNFICRRFVTLCLFHLHRLVGISSYLPAYEDGTECSETSAYKIKTPGNYPDESIQHSEHGGSLKSRNIKVVFGVLLFVDQKHGPYEKNEERVVSAFETWRWKGMLKVKWTNRIKNDEVFQRAKEERLLFAMLRS